LVFQEVREKIPGYVDLACKTTTAMPKATINWYKEQQGQWKNLEGQISKGLRSTKDCETRKPGFFIIGEDGSHLVICHPVHQTYTGLYRCTAENSEGSDERQAKLNILGKFLFTLTKD
jgi:hypothetical protein